MQLKGELAFSLDCVTSFLILYLFCGNWMEGVVHEKLHLVPLPPGIVVRGPLLLAGLTVAVSRILKMDKWFIIFVGYDRLLVCLSSAVFSGRSGSQAEVQVLRFM